MDDKLLLSLLLCGLCVCMCALESHEFHFVNVNSSWSEAQQFCRQHYTDLATPRNEEDLKLLLRPASYSGRAWIGLRYTTGTSFQNWRGGRPHTQNLCVSLNTNTYWYDEPCMSKLPFLCYRDMSGKTYTLVNPGGTWAEGWVYCREHYMGLAVIENMEENAAAYAVTGGKWAWINTWGDWHWSDGSMVFFSNWPSTLVYSPDLLNSSCTVEDQEHMWWRASCEEKLPFFCYKGPERKIFVKVSMSSILDLSDPIIQGQLTQMIEQELREAGANVTWASPPKLQIEKEEDKDCPLSE